MARGLGSCLAAGKICTAYNDLLLYIAHKMSVSHQTCSFKQQRPTHQVENKQANSLLTAPSSLLQRSLGARHGLPPGGQLQQQGQQGQGQDPR